MMRKSFILVCMLFCSIGSASAQVSVAIGVPGLSIGINLPTYPELVQVPGYPVYYAPRMSSNYFFYDGMYWVYQQDNWYASTWYNGPWGLVAPEAVPAFILRVPVRYYRQPPVYFHGWASSAPPHWGEHWGGGWEQQRHGWESWNRNAVPAPAPLPVYQRQYSGNRYPHADQQQVIQSRNYRYQPQDTVVQQHYQAQRVQAASAPSTQRPQGAPQQRTSPQQNPRASSQPPSSQYAAPPAAHGQPRRGGGDVQKPAAVQAPPQGRQAAQQPQRQPQPQPQQGAAQHAQRAPTSQGQDKGPQGKAHAQDPRQGQDRGHDKGEQQGGDRNK